MVRVCVSACLLGHAVRSNARDKRCDDVVVQRWIAQLLAGADQALATAQAHGIHVAVLKEASPSCGSTYSDDGTFTGARVPYPGVTRARLQAAGVRVFTEAPQTEASVRALERPAGTAAP